MCKMPAFSEVNFVRFCARCREVVARRYHESAACAKADGRRPLKVLRRGVEGVQGAVPDFHRCSHFDAAVRQPCKRI